MVKATIRSLIIVSCFVLAGTAYGQVDPDAAPHAEVDRFSEEAGTLFVRTADNGLPEANAPIDFDQAPFITQGLGPGGEVVRYYNFDVQPTEPAPIYVLFREGEDAPVEGQLNIVDVIPGDEGYNDFWDVIKVTVPEDYVANTVTSFDEIETAGYPQEEMGVLVNCPVVPEGSTATLRFGEEEDTGLVRGWYDGQVVFYFNFSEAPLSETGNGMVPASPIYVAFNINPGEDGGGPPSGFMTEPDSPQTHNVVATVPGDEGYSPLWRVNIYDNAEFDDVYNLSSAQAATTLATGAALVNCPIVSRSGHDPDTAPEASIDRFSEEAGTLFVRTADNGLPEANAPIDFDQAPFITQGLGPGGEVVRYYNFDVQPTEPAPIFVLFRDGEDTPVEGQLNIINTIPGDEGYNDFWHVHRVTVPEDYVANAITSVAALMDAGYPITETETLVNCPVVPEGSTATLRFGEGKSQGTGLVQGWYDGQVVYYFNFSEAPLMRTGSGMVPASPIYVAFNINPDEDGGGPPSGFMTEEGSAQTHNVVATVPGDEGYSPLWSVNVYDNAEFESVMDLTTAQAATILATGAALVNCPIVSVDTDTAVEEGDEQPAGFVLHANYPNPFNPATTITFDLHEASHARLTIYNVLGEKIVDLIDAVRPAGTHEVSWNGTDSQGLQVATGVYLYKLEVGAGQEVRTMILLR